jgi:hypothetical protein
VASTETNLVDLIIKGQNHYKGNIVSIFEKSSTGFAQELDIDGILEPEPTNAHDPNAVILRVHGYAIGYIAQQKAASVKQQIGSGIKVRCRLMWNRDPESEIFSVAVTAIL